ncbi:LAFE_0H08108g1_1 [Lachancea fermentati]|uniref:LAFE_0H08108g1_1 n=1 Tax=Lachancea fermentati TaxID=4955 RepID=A0A1G4MJZ6_LACFM|nr:LAFE_0H08108g1_1 [Lachancea fermentati]
MIVVLGATGHVGAYVAKKLLEEGHNVTVVTRNAEKAHKWRELGAEAAVLDIHDVQALNALLQKARRAFLLNPPANPSGDTDEEERRSVSSILSALKGVSLEKIVVQSTYGAQPGRHCGDLGVLYEFEKETQKLEIPLCVIRGAYYMSNWLSLAAGAKETGVLPSLIPSTLSVPMVAPQDIGELAAQLLSSEIENVGMFYIEGPCHYSPDDVARCFTASFNRSVRVEYIPQQEWNAFYLKNGFSKKAAASYANMNALFIGETFERPQNPLRGLIDLRTYFQTELERISLL